MTATRDAAATEPTSASEQVAGRRPSANLPAVPTQRLNEQLPLNQNQLVNDIHEAVGMWRASDIHLTDVEPRPIPQTATALSRPRRPT